MKQKSQPFNRFIYQALLFAFIFLLIAIIHLRAQTPELVFRNPVLKSGTANQQGAIYRFSDITTGVDAKT